MKTLKGALFMSIKPKVDIDVLLYMFQEYEKGVSFQYLIDTLQLDINVNTLYPKYKYYKTHGIETLLTQKQYNHYSKELKLKVVNEYLNSNQSTQDIAIKYNIRSSTQVKNWIKMYTVGKEIKNQSPKTGVYIMKARKTTFEERVTIVEYYLNHKQSYREVAEHFNISYGQIYQWVHKYQAHGKNGLVDGRGKGKPKSMMTPEEQKEAEIQALKAQNRLLEMENDVFKKVSSIGKRDGSKRKQITAYKTIEALKHQYPIQRLCRILGISRASYYKWVHYQSSELELENEQLKREIESIYHKYNGIYGYRRIYIYIRLKLGKQVNRKRIYRLMKELNLKAVIRQKRKPYRRSTPQITSENKLNRQFDIDTPNKVWLTDVTEFKIKEGSKIYLSAIYDLGAKRIVSYELGPSNNNQLVFKTFNQAIEKVENTKGILFHSDRGFQYTSKTFKHMLDECGMIQSMSRVSKCIDNGPMEGVWGTIKSEIFRGNKHFKFNSVEEATKTIHDFILFFNHERITLKMADSV
ncbi:TPA: IS3-like element ISSau2 family transposase [Staphylococcus aureus]|nr:IS3-like element ISSau2 family transposase [Staphylococcus aureus]